MAESAPLWTWDALVAAAEGTAEGATAGTITGFSIDTRSLVPGEVFVALTDQRDGHDFVGAAFAAGAAAALVRRDFVAPEGAGPLIRVDDPLVALGRIAVAARARLRPEARVVAVTGSAGKTGTKEMLRACLATAGKVHAPEKSFNNHWGVPLTLARMPADVDFAVIEIGMNHTGEISPLTRMARPHIAVITNVLPVHVGNFADGEEGVARAKAEIFEGLEPGGTAVLPRDSRHFMMLDEAARLRGLRVSSFGESNVADAILERPKRANERVDRWPEDPKQRVDASIRFHNGPREFAYYIGALGNHIAFNSLAVLLVLREVGALGGRALEELEHVNAAPGRGARLVLNAGTDRILLIDESYNANPASMRAAIAVLGGVSRDVFLRRVAVLGDMLELGERAEAYHLGLADPIADAEADVVFACGPNMRKLFETLATEKRGAWAPDSTALLPHVVEALRPGDAVMVKGSLGSRMAPIVAAIKAKFST